MRTARDVRFYSGTNWLAAVPSLDPLWSRSLELIDVRVSLRKKTHTEIPAKQSPLKNRPTQSSERYQLKFCVLSSSSFASTVGNRFSTCEQIFDCCEDGNVRLKTLMLTNHLKLLIVFDSYQMATDNFSEVAVVCPPFIPVFIRCLRLWLKHKVMASKTSSRFCSAILLQKREQTVRWRRFWKDTSSDHERLY